MKTVKKENKIQRQPDKQAAQMVIEQGWRYCAKKEWKEKVRDAMTTTKKKLKKKTQDFGAHKLIPIKTRFQGKK